MVYLKTTIFVLAALSVSAAAFVAPTQEKTRVGGAAMLNALVLDGRTEIQLRSLQMPPATAGGGTTPQDVQFETLEVFDRSLVGWMNEVFTGQARKRPGRAVYSNITLKRGSIRTFHDALITQVTVPALDRSVSTPAALKVNFKAVLGKPTMVASASTAPRAGNPEDVATEQLQAQDGRPSGGKSSFDERFCAEIRFSRSSSVDLYAPPFRRQAMGGEACSHARFVGGRRSGRCGRRVLGGRWLRPRDPHVQDAANAPVEPGFAVRYRFRPTRPGSNDDRRVEDEGSGVGRKGRLTGTR